MSKMFIILSLNWFFCLTNTPKPKDSSFAKWETKKRSKFWHLTKWNQKINIIFHNNSWHLTIWAKTLYSNILTVLKAQAEQNQICNIKSSCLFCTSVETSDRLGKRRTSVIFAYCIHTCMEERFTLDVKCNLIIPGQLNWSLLPGIYSQSRQMATADGGAASIRRR